MTSLASKTVAVVLMTPPAMFAADVAPTIRRIVRRMMIRAVTVRVDAEQTMLLATTAVGIVADQLALVMTILAPEIGARDVVKAGDVVAVVAVTTPPAVPDTIAGPLVPA
jgi:hypothetical protein